MVLKKILAPKQKEKLKSIYRAIFPRQHIIITGTGRTGTTFLVQLLTNLGLKTGYEPQNFKFHTYARAGLEHDVRDNGTPFIIKNPGFCDCADEVFKRKDIVIKHIIVPMRDLHAAAESRRYTEKTTPSQRTGVAGGLWHTDDPEKQEIILLNQLYKLIIAIANTNVPLIFLKYPRIVKDSKYLYEKLKPIFRRISYRKFNAIFDKTVNLDLIHQFNENDK